MSLYRYLITAFLVLPSMANAHGGDKPGPHGGNVEMPGAFHTELVVNKDLSLNVYLTDMSFQNPTTKDSSVKAFAREKKSEVPFSCSAQDNYFHCVPTKKYSQTGELVIQAVREKAVGNDAVYKLPLKFTKPASKETSSSDHSHH